MKEFECYLMCVITPIIYILLYIAGKYNLLELICKILEDKARDCKFKETEWEEIEKIEQALEKQKPKKIIRKIQKEDLKIGCVTFKAGTNTYWCPACNKAVTGSDTYCRWCGQAIDFGG